MGRWIIFCVAVASLTATASADIMFNYNALAEPTSRSGVQDYMSALYGSSVRVGDMRLEDGGSHPFPTGSAASGSYMRLNDNNQGDMEIHFQDEAITAMRLDLAIFDDGSNGTWDFNIRAYETGFNNGSAYSRENPNPAKLVNSYIFVSPNDSAYATSTGWLIFNAPVSLVVLSDGGVRDVGFDNLEVRPVSQVATVPAPGAWLLGVVGLGLGGSLRRRLGCAQ